MLYQLWCIQDRWTAHERIGDPSPDADSLMNSSAADDAGAARVLPVGEIPAPCWCACGQCVAEDEAEMEDMLTLTPTLPLAVIALTDAGLIPLPAPRADSVKENAWATMDTESRRQFLRDVFAAEI